MVIGDMHFVIVFISSKDSLNIIILITINNTPTQHIISNKVTSLQFSKVKWFDKDFATKYDVFVKIITFTLLEYNT